MKLQTPTFLMLLGNNLRYLRETSETRPLAGENFVFEAYDELLVSLGRMRFEVSLKWIEHNFENEMTNLRTRVEGSEDPGAERLSQSEAHQFKTKMVELEDVVFAEAATRKIAMPVPRRYDLEKLTERPSELFPNGLFGQLPALCRKDILSGCRAIAFDLPTAAAFHLLRATEECLRELHCSYLPRGERDKQTWHRLIKDLQQKPRKPRPDTLVLTQADYLREHFRNPTNHPEKSYEIDEAQDLLNMCIDVISRIARDDKVAKRLAALAGPGHQGGGRPSPEAG